MDKGAKFIFGLVLASILIFGGTTAFLIDTFTNIPDFKEMRGKVTVPIKLADKSWSTKVMGPKSGDWAAVSQISNHVLMAVIASEDASFFSHQGVDYHELEQAIKKDWEEKRWARGGSTITQQVVKNVYLGRQKTLTRKFKEFIWAREIEKVLSKTEILCFYLNMVEWGPNLYGIRSASRHYFGIPPSQISPKQAAFLAMLLPSPIKYYANYRKKNLTPWATKRVAHILKVMNRMGFIDDGSYREALSEKLWGVTGATIDTGIEEKAPESDPEGDESGSESVDVLKEPVEKAKSKPNLNTKEMMPESTPQLVDPIIEPIKENEENSKPVDTAPPIEAPVESPAN